MLHLDAKKVLIAEPIIGSEYTYDYMRGTGCELIIGPHVSKVDEGFTEKELIKFGNEVDVIIGMSREKITRRVIENSKRLRAICKYGIGVDHIDVQAATEHGILVTNTPVHNLTVAEFTIALMLSVLKKITHNHTYVKEGGWRDESGIGFELYGKTVGLVGLGGIGKQVVRRLQGWDVSILVYDPYIDNEEAAKAGVQIVDWETLFRNSDIISLHLPLTEKTKGLVGSREFSVMKKTSVIVNTARGKIIDEDALINVLQCGKIHGAGLDVFEDEPVSLKNPLLNMNNVVIAPHIAGWSLEALRRMAQHASQDCVRALKGELPINIVNKEAVNLWKKKYVNIK